MKKVDENLNEVEQLLKKVRLAQPPEELKARIVGAAQETWEEVPADIPWRVPLRHLGLSAAAAVLIVSCANYYSVRTVAPWQAGRPVAVRMEWAGSEDTLEVPYSPLVRHLIATCGAPANDASALLDYLQSVRKTLDEAGQDNAAEGSGPSDHESLEGKIGITEYWNGGMVAGLRVPDSRHSIIPLLQQAIVLEGVAACLDDPSES